MGPQLRVLQDRLGGVSAATRLDGDWSPLWSNSAIHFQGDQRGVYINAIAREGQTAAILNLPLDGSPPIEMLAIADVARSPVWIVDETHLYHSSCHESSACRLDRVSKQGGQSEHLASIPVPYAAVRAIDASHVYLTSPGAVWKVAKADGDLQVLSPVSGSVVSPQLAVDSQRLLFIEKRDRNYRLRAVPKSGEPTELIATATFAKGLTQLAQDDRYVYLLHGGEEILALPFTARR